ncbi:BTB/POZ domain containing protein [Nitzschia inconspicua]|uniref:BTB/POZ domain containing protein n=1 Tax=Nitzschia inconspicua TaxID=303405 RepID=A0A9K3LS34_9STRA|nr:BTB/POZ domain containing protein [Nitzschia inconspicua]
MVSSMSMSTSGQIMKGFDMEKEGWTKNTTQQVHRVRRTVDETDSRDEQPMYMYGMPRSPDRDERGLRTISMDLNHSLGSSSTAVHSQQLKSLSWRADPRTSFSDWTLEVVGMEGGVEKSVSLYYAHSNVIAWGPRKGGYFVHLFQERMSQRPPSNMSRIQVPSVEAGVFPIMLDFMYCENSLPLSADKACILYAMANKFAIPQLQKAIQKFVERYLNLGQMIEFIQYAREQQDYTHKEIDKLILCAVSKLCGYLVKHPEEAIDVEPTLLLYTLEQRAKVLNKLKNEDPRTYSGKWEADRSKLLSKVVAECCNAATGEDSQSSNGEYPRLTRHQFQQMMTHLPALDNDAAMVLMQVDRKLIPKITSVKNINKTSPQERIETGTSSGFDEKCVEVMAAQWRKGMLQKSEKENERLIEFLQELSPRVLAKLLVKVSQQYELDILATEESDAARHEILSEPSRKSNVSTKVNINLPVEYPSVEMSHDDFYSPVERVPPPDRYDI